MTLYNLGSDVSQVTAGEHTFILPNCILGDFTGRTYSYTKYDSDGNKYVISNKGVVINDTIDFTADNRCIMLGYDPDNKTISVFSKYPDPASLPNIYTSDRAVTGMSYNSDVEGSGYDSFGAALARGEKFYEDLNIGWYNLSNVIPNIPFYSVNHFVGLKSDFSFINMVPDSGGGTSWSASLDLDDVVTDFNPEEPLIPDTDPYNPDGDETRPGGGNGDRSLDSDDIDIPSLPSLSAVDTGFITLYRPDLTQLRDLANYMWSSPVQVWDNVKKLWANPMDTILGLSIVPVQPTVGALKNITVADIPTGVSSYPITSQYVEVNCGSIDVKEYWGAYLDYEPFTKAELYLPYIGTHPIAIDDIMGRTITIKYHVDVLSGACTAYVKCGSSVLYEFIGQCSSSIPINGNDWTNVINGVLSVAAAIGTMVATGGASAPAAASTIASTAVNSMKPSIEKSGSMSGTGGMLGIQKPYLIITRPRQAVPARQNQFMGYPSYITYSLGNVSGYTVVEEIHIEGIGATDDELKEIEALLKEGVIL